jgi:hypothetical protein
MLIAQKTSLLDKRNLIITDRRFRDAAREDMLMNTTIDIPSRHLAMPIESPHACWIVHRARHVSVKFAECCESDNEVSDWNPCKNLASFGELQTLRVEFTGFPIHDIISHLPTKLISLDISLTYIPNWVGSKISIARLPHLRHLRAEIDFFDPLTLAALTKLSSLDSQYMTGDSCTQYFTVPSSIVSLTVGPDTIPSPTSNIPQLDAFSFMLCFPMADIVQRISSWNAVSSLRSMEIRCGPHDGECLDCLRSLTNLTRLTIASKEKISSHHGNPFPPSLVHIELQLIFYNLRVLEGDEYVDVPPANPEVGVDEMLSWIMSFDSHDKCLPSLGKLKLDSCSLMKDRSWTEHHIHTNGDLEVL